MDIRYGAAVRRALQSSTDVFYATRVHLSGRLHQAGHARTHTHRQRPSSTTKLQRAAPRQQIHTHTHTHEWRKKVAAKYSRVVRKPPEI